MKNTYDLTEKFMESRSVGLENMDSLTVDYYLVVDEVKREDGSLLCENYGIKIVSCDISGSIDSTKISGITTSYTKICRLIRMMVKNEVTPVSLEYIIEDFLAQ